jgi:hypothetical protein
MVPSEHLRVFVGQVCEQTRQDCDGPCWLSRSTKREMLEWIEGHWEEIGPALTSVAASQRRMSTPQLPPFHISEEWHRDQSTIDKTPQFSFSPSSFSGAHHLNGRQQSLHLWVAGPWPLEIRWVLECSSIKLDKKLINHNQMHLLQQIQGFERRISCRARVIRALWCIEQRTWSFIYRMKCVSDCSIEASF